MSIPNVPERAGWSSGPRPRALRRSAPPASARAVRFVRVARRSRDRTRGRGGRCAGARVRPLRCGAHPSRSATPSASVQRAVGAASPGRPPRAMTRTGRPSGPAQAPTPSNDPAAATQVAAIRGAGRPYATIDGSAIGRALGAGSIQAAAGAATGAAAARPATRPAAATALAAAMITKPFMMTPAARTALDGAGSRRATSRTCCVDRHRIQGFGRGCCVAPSGTQHGGNGRGGVSRRRAERRSQGRAPCGCSGDCLDPARSSCGCD